MAEAVRFRSSGGPRSGAAIHEPIDLPTLSHLAAFRDLPIKRPTFSPAPCPASWRSTWILREFRHGREPPGRRADGPSCRSRSSLRSRMCVRWIRLHRAHAARRARHETRASSAQPRPMACAWAPKKGTGQTARALFRYGRAFARFTGWRAACFVANPRFVDVSFGHARS